MSLSRPRAAREAGLDAMHIVDTTLFFAPHSGGVKRYLLSKHAWLATQPGVRHSLVVPGRRTREAGGSVYERRALRIPLGGGYRVPLATSRWRAALIALAPDVVEAGDPYTPAWAARAAAAARGVPAVAFVHSDLATLLRRRCGAHVGRAAEHYLRALYGGFDLVTAPSRTIADRLDAAGIGRLAVQPLGVDAGVFHPCRRDDALRLALDVPHNARLLAFAGRLAPEKRIDVLQRAVARLGAPYHLVLIGGRERRRLAPTCTQLPYEHDDVALARLLASVDAFVHAGAVETFGLVAIEAMACGRPVVAANAGALPELVDDAVGALVAPNDPEALAAAIRALFERDLDAIGRAARTRVERRYAWPRVLALQLDRYRALIGANAPREAPALA